MEHSDRTQLVLAARPQVNMGPSDASVLDISYRFLPLIFTLILTTVLGSKAYSAKKKVTPLCESVHLGVAAQAYFNLKEIPQLDLMDIPWNHHGYKQGRALRQVNTLQQSYEGMLDSKFIRKVTRLSPDKVIVDVGAASFSALAELAKDYTYRDKHPPKLIGIAPEKSQGIVRNVEYLKTFGPDRFAIIAKYAENVKEIPPDSVDQIIDVHAAVSYSRTLDKVFQQYFTWLKVKGEIDIRYGADVTFIKTASGKFITVTEWLQSIPGIEVTEVKTKYLRIIKKQAVVLIPKLNLLRYDVGEPPMRWFEIAE